MRNAKIHLLNIHYNQSKSELLKKTPLKKKISLAIYSSTIINKTLPTCFMLFAPNRIHELLMTRRGPVRLTVHYPSNN